MSANAPVGTTSVAEPAADKSKDDKNSKQDDLKKKDSAKVNTDKKPMEKTKGKKEPK